MPGRNFAEELNPAPRVESKPVRRNFALELRDKEGLVGKLREQGIAQSGDRLAIAEKVKQGAQEAQTHSGPSGTVQPPLEGLAGETPLLPTSADKSTRMQLAGDLKTAGRVLLETAGGAGGASVARRVAGNTALGRGAKLATETVATAVGEGLGSLASETFDPSGDALGTAKTTAAIGGAVDAITVGLGGLATKLARGASGSNLDLGALDAMDDLGPGNLPSSGRLSTNEAVDFTENVIENSIFSTGMVRRKNAKATLKARQNIDALVQSYTKGASKQDLDILVRDVVSGELQVVKESAEKLYAQVDQIAPSGVGTEDLIKLRNSIVSENQAGAAGDGLKALVVAIDRTLGVPPKLRGIEANRMLSTTARRVQGTGFDSGASFLVRDAKPFVSFRDAQKLRSDALAAQQSSSDVFASQVSGTAKRIGSVTDRSMEVAAAASGSEEAFQLWRTANAFWKEGAEAFSEGVMQSLAAARPDDLRQIIMKGNKPQQIARFRKLTLGGVGGKQDTAETIKRRAQRVLRSQASPAEKEIAQRRLDNLAKGEEAWNTLIGGVLLDISRASDPGSGLITDAARGSREIVGSSAIKRFSDLGPETLKELFPNRADRVKAERALRTLEITQSGTGLGTGNMATKFVQAGILFGLAPSILSGDLGAVQGGVFVLAGPKVLGKILMDERAIRWLTVGNKVGVKDRVKRRAFAQFAALAYREGAVVRDAQGNRFDPTNTQTSKDFKDFNNAALARQR